MNKLGAVITVFVTMTILVLIGSCTYVYVIADLEGVTFKTEIEGKRQ